jgi:exodeoxyribonuclease VII large subunit
VAESQNQWDFGELFSKEEVRRVLSVSELTKKVKRQIEEGVGQIWVEGEITNLRRQSSGHIYFSIKDDNTQLSCVLFRGVRMSQRDTIEDGQKVVLQGSLTVYEARGQYQLIVKTVELQGIGALQVQFERLKNSLNGEGLFDTARKRKLPSINERIGIVTSLSGAALRDVLHVVQRRQPTLEIVLVDSRVQGAGAEAEIIKGIEWLNSLARSEPLDLILITRGGGSIEDLWAFNEESLARSIFSSVVPVVSAVGHEIDYTISDFVADFRAATPSAAAEIITSGGVMIQEKLGSIAERLNRAAIRRFRYINKEVEANVERMARCHPRRQLQQRMQRVDDLCDELIQGGREFLKQQDVRLRNLSDRLVRVRPSKILKDRNKELEQQKRQFHDIVKGRMGQLKRDVEALNDRLRLLDPKNIVSRGYSITTDAKTGRILRSVKKTHSGQTIITQMSDGDIESTIN